MPEAVNREDVDREDSGLHIALHAHPDEDHMQVAARHLGGVDGYGKCRIGSPDNEGTFHVYLPHARAETRRAVADLGLQIVTADEAHTHRPLSSVALAHYRDRNGSAPTGENGKSSVPTMNVSASPEGSEVPSL